MIGLYRKTELLKVIGETQEGNIIAQNKSDESDTWVIPRDVFEKTYEKVGELNDGEEA